jgi:hypothetical protein
MEIKCILRIGTLSVFFNWKIHSGTGHPDALSILPKDFNIGLS